MFSTIHILALPLVLGWQLGELPLLASGYSTVDHDAVEPGAESWLRAESRQVLPGGVKKPPGSDLALVRIAQGAQGQVISKAL